MHRVVVRCPLIPSFSRLTDTTECAQYWSRLLALWGISGARARSESFFPCCNPRSIASRTLDIVRTGEYQISLKSDGVRYLLLLTLRPENGGAIALMIDRSRNMYEVEVVAPEEYFARGTVLEGELVWKQPDERAMVYHIFDALVVKGERLANKPFAHRLEVASNAVRLSDDVRDADDCEARALETDTIVMTHFAPRIEMRPKHFVGREHAVRLWRERLEMEHRVDGLILQRVDAPYKCGTASDNSCLKWKEHSTVDLRGPPDALRAADADLPHRIFDRDVVVLPSRIVGEDECALIEYSVGITPTTVELMAVRRRPDKRDANGLRVVRETVNDMINNVSPEEIASV